MRLMILMVITRRLYNVVTVKKLQMKARMIINLYQEKG